MEQEKKTEPNWDEKISRILNAYNEISKSINPSQLVKLDLTASQIKVLASFSEKENFKMTELAKTHNVSVSTMTSMIDRLINGDYVSRRNDNKDRRIVFVTLTQRGKKTVKELMKLRKQGLEKFLIELQPKERKEFIDSIEKVAGCIRSVREKYLKKAKNS